MKWFALLFALSTCLLSSRNLQAQTGGVKVQFSDSLYMADESNKNAKLIIVLSGTPTEDVTVTYKTSSGTAVAGVDYGKDSNSAEITDTVTFQAGPGKATSKVIKIPLLNKGDYSNQIVSFTVSLTEASGATIEPPSTATVNILDNDPAPTCKIGIAGVGANKQNNPGGYVSVNANNDNGSALTYDGTNKVPAGFYGIPAKRDKDVQPMPFGPDGVTRIGDPDLAQITIETKGLKAGNGETVELSVQTQQGARSSIWFYDQKTKATVIGLPAVWQAGAIPASVFVEGKLESASLMEQTLTLQIKKGQVVVDTSTCVLTVTPVLTNFEVVAAQGAVADTAQDPMDQRWYLDSGAGQRAETMKETVAAQWDNVRGDLRIVQTVKHVNNLTIAGQAGTWGADLGPRKFNFDPDFVPAGTTLLDTAKDETVPFATQQEKNPPPQRAPGGVVTNSITDSPALKLQPKADLVTPGFSVLPALGGTTNVDVTFSFVSYATVSYQDKSLYFIGQQSWNIRFAGGVKQPAPMGRKKYTFTQAVNNPNAPPPPGNNGAPFAPGVRNNGIPAAIGQPYTTDNPPQALFANVGDAAFR